MTAAQPMAAGPAGYLRVRIGRTQFLLPDTESLQAGTAPAGDESGSALTAHDPMPVFALDETLHPAPAGTVTAGCRVLLHSGAARVLVACDAADRVGPEGVKLYPLPGCMRTPKSVFSAVAALGDNIHGVCRAEDLYALLAAPPDGTAVRAGDGG